jgi:hypothetical protein
MTADVDGWERLTRLREPFPPEQIGTLPRAGVRLSYVGHAAVTDRLLDADAAWSWEPVAFDADGVPLVRYRDKDVVLWIRLTVCGVTRLGVGIVQAGAVELEKQLISDALRNAAMRFGVALDLWSKEDLHSEQRDESGQSDFASDEDRKAIGAWLAQIKTKASREVVRAEVVEKYGAGVDMLAADVLPAIEFIQRRTQELAKIEAKPAAKSATCETCGGSGLVLADDEESEVKCDACDGTGELRKDATDE